MAAFQGSKSGAWTGGSIRGGSRARGCVKHHRWAVKGGARQGFWLRLGAGRVIVRGADLGRKDRRSFLDI